jgi:nucleoside-diphosphate kinase
MTERTLIIVKPDAVQADKTQAMLEAFGNNGFRMLTSKQVSLSRSEAEGFYAEHRGKPFFDDLVAFMTSGPCVVAVLEADDAVQAARAIVGATNPSQAAEGTLRRSFGSTTTRNAVHASDSLQSAQREVSFFFPDLAPSAGAGGN